MNTYFGLLAEFDGRTELPLEEVAPRFFGISPRTAAFRAGAQALLSCGGFAEKPVAGKCDRFGVIH